MLNPEIREQLRSQGFSMDGTFGGAAPVDKDRMANMHRIKLAHRSETVPLADDFEPGQPELWHKVEPETLLCRPGGAQAAYPSSSSASTGCTGTSNGSSPGKKLYLTLAPYIRLCRSPEAWFPRIAEACREKLSALTTTGKDQWSVKAADVACCGNPAHSHCLPGLLPLSGPSFVLLLSDASLMAIPCLISSSIITEVLPLTPACRFPC